MNHRKIQFFRCLFLLFLLFSMSAAAIPAQEPVKMPAGELRQVFDLIENPQRREAFIEDLKKFIQAKGMSEKAQIEKKKRKLLLIESLFQGFERLSKKIVGAGYETISLLAQAPQAFQSAKVFLAQSENQWKLLKLF